MWGPEQAADFVERTQVDALAIAVGTPHGAYKHGVRKVNIDTDIRLAMTAAIRRFMVENPSKFDPREYLKPAMLAAKAVCKERYVQFGCASMASKIKAESLDAIATKYRSGELAQVVQ